SSRDVDVEQSRTGLIIINGLNQQHYKRENRAIVRLEAGQLRHEPTLSKGPRKMRNKASPS
uniref:Uncharacterized protein n=1 Tax=Anopheles atroparvus TaxID=41427 RepID=A0AAG5DQA2_ANOAO